MNQDQIKQKATNWYLSMTFNENVAMCAKYFPETDFYEITWEQVLEMYIKEHQNKQP